MAVPLIYNKLPILTLASTLHPASSVDSIPEQAEVWHLLADHSGADGPGVDPDPKLELIVRLVVDGERAHGVYDRQRHQADLARVVVAIPLRKTGHNHVGVTYCFYLKN